LPSHFLPALNLEIERCKQSLEPISEVPGDEQAFKECIIGLSVLFPIQDMGEDGFALRQGILNDIFFDYPIEMVRKACSDYARSAEWFPRPKQLIDRIEVLIGSRKCEMSNLEKLKANVREENT
jgi:hypothetical protein